MFNNHHSKDKILNLAAQNEEDLVIFSTLCQDSIVKISNIKWAKKTKRFNILLTRVCWELNDLSKKKPPYFKRVNSILSFHNVLLVKTRGIQQSNSNMITSLLALNYSFDSYDEQSIDLIFSGNGQISISIECVEAFLKDISEPFESTSTKFPSHETNYPL